MFFNFKKKDGGKIINSIQLTEAVWKTHDEAEIKKLVYEHGADEINYLIKLILRDANFETKNLSDKSIDILRMIEDSGKDYDRYELARYYIFMDRFALDYTGKTADMCFKYICNDEDFASGLIGYVSGNRLAYYANQKDKLEPYWSLLKFRCEFLRLGVARIMPPAPNGRINFNLYGNPVFRYEMDKDDRTLMRVGWFTDVTPVKTDAQFRQKLYAEGEALRADKSCWELLNHQRQGLAEQYYKLLTTF